MSLALQIVLWIVGILAFCFFYACICYAFFKIFHPDGTLEDYIAWKEKLAFQINIEYGNFRL